MNKITARQEPEKTEIDPVCIMWLTGSQLLCMGVRFQSKHLTLHIR